jgi:glycerol-3-phosphate O-acyltransferase
MPNHLAQAIADLGAARVLVVTDASTDVERAAIRAEMAQANGAGDLVRPDDPAFARALADDDVVLLPVRASWLAGRETGTRAALRDLLLLRDPRRPSARSQAKLADGKPGRIQVVVGGPARVGDLRTRWVQENGGRGGQAEFARYVRRRGAIALERAERDVVGQRYKAPQEVVDEICDSAHFQDQVAEVAKRLGKPERQVLAEARTMLEDVVASQSALATDAFNTVTGPLYEKAWTVDVDVSSLDHLREVNRTKGLVFLPAHRSYMDPLILNRVLQDADFPRNHMPGGNNMSFWPIGPLAKRSGVIFIPRTLSGDELAKLVFREYLGYLASKKFNLEWYMESGRSRTGKLRPPKFGLLQFVVDAMRNGRVDDVELVPVSISYDNLPEVGLMAAEEQGQPKKPEGLGWFARYARDNSRLLGTVFVRFGEPLSLRDRLDAAEQGGADHRLAMQKVGFEVFHRINAVTPITPMSLVTLALLGVDGRALTAEEVLEVVAPFVDYVDRRALPLTDRASVVGLAGIRATLKRLADAGIVAIEKAGPDPLHVIKPGQHHAAAFYRNSAIHWFVNRAIMEASIALAAEEGAEDLVQAAWQECLALRELLKFEFFFSDKRTFYDELLAERALLGVTDEADIPGSPEGVQAVLRAAGFLAAPIVLRPFVEAYLVVTQTLAARNPRRPVDQKAFIDEAAAAGRQLLLQKKLRNPESVSLELYASALKLVGNRDLFDPGRAEVQAGRQELAEEVARALRAVEAVERLARDRTATSLGADV